MLCDLLKTFMSDYILNLPVLCLGSGSDHGARSPPTRGLLFASLEENTGDLNLGLNTKSWLEHQLLVATSIIHQGARNSIHFWWHVWNVFYCKKRSSHLGKLPWPPLGWCYIRLAWRHAHSHWSHTAGIKNTNTYANTLTNTITKTSRITNANTKYDRSASAWTLPVQLASQRTMYLWPGTGVIIVIVIVIIVNVIIVIAIIISMYAAPPLWRTQWPSFWMVRPHGNH